MKNKATGGKDTYSEKDASYLNNWVSTTRTTHINLSDVDTDL